MSIKFPISAIALATMLTIGHSAIASAEVYKTSKGQVVITGLTAKQKYPIQGINAQNKPVKRKDLAANTCGEALVDGAGKYKSLIIGTEKIDPATLPTKVHPRCTGKKTATAKPIKNKAAKRGVMSSPTPTATPVADPSSVMPK